MKRFRLACLPLAFALAFTLSPASPAQAVTPVHAAVPQVSKTKAKMRAIAKLSISPTKVKSQVSKARASIAKYSKLIPKGHSLKTSNVRAFSLGGGKTLVVFPLLAKSYPGGALSFEFSGKTLATSQQLIFSKNNTQTASARVYTNGKLTKKISVSLYPFSRSLGSRSFVGYEDSFTTCWNSMPQWLIDLVSLLCTVSCLTATSPPTAIVCVACLIGLAGSLASFALECADGKVDGR